MADNQHPRSTNGPAGKTRSPVERVIVWGLIGGLAVAAGFEFLSKNGHETALKTLQDKIAAVDEDAKHPEVTEDDVKKAVGNKTPSKAKDYQPGEAAANGAKRMEVYSWFTLNPANTREIYVWYTGKGKDGKEAATVLEVQSTETISALSKVASGAEDASAGAPMAGGPEGAGMRGPAGGGPGGMSGRGMAPPGGGGRGGQRGRPAADKIDDDKADPDKADPDKPDAKATDEEKPAADEPAEDKTEEKAAEKTE